MRFAIALLATASLLLPGGSAAAPAPFSAVAATFVREYEARDPLFADSIGIHAFDGRLADYSAAGNAARAAWLRGWHARLTALETGTLSAQDRADERALRDTVDLELFEDATLDPNRTDPTVYAGIIGNAVYALTGRPFAPAAVRYADVARRLAYVPGIVRAAQAQLTGVPTRVATLQAIDDNAGNLEMYRGLGSAAGVPNGVRTAIAARLPAALAAIQAYSTFLRRTLLPRSTASPRVGARVYDRELDLALGTSETRAQLVASARAAFAANRARMLEIAIPLDRRFFPSRAADEGKPNAQDVVVRRVLDRLALDHPSRDGIFRTAKAAVERSEAFLRTDPVVPLPVPSTLHVVPTPDFMAGFSGASLDPPGPFTPLAGSYFYIDRIPASWSTARVASYLRDYNDDDLQMLAIHEAVPGHYVQFRYNAAVPSLVRRVFPNGAFVEGWAVYGEGMMLDAGFRRDDPGLRLVQLKWRLREEANTIIDAGFHTGGLSKAACLDFLERESYQEPAQALEKWHRLQLSHDQLTSYFVGNEAIRIAQEAERAALGSHFDLGDFNRRVLAMGSVEPRFVATLLATPVLPSPAVATPSPQVAPATAPAASATP